MIQLLGLPLPLLTLVTTAVHAATTPRTPPSGQTIPLVRRAHEARNTDALAEWAQKNKLSLESKYGIPSSSSQNENQKRSTGTNLLVNQGLDSSFYGSIAVGTPPVSYNVILDTGSSDLWLAADGFCSSRDCADIPTFDPTRSSTVKVTTSQFGITYGSGFASGRLVSDTVQMAGFSVQDQVFGLCNNVSQSPPLLDFPVSGLMGLAFETIASSQAVPFWQSLAKSGAWDEKLMAFQLTRYTNISLPANTVDAPLEPGGSFTMGFVNSSLYTGDIEYNNIPGGQGTYWIQEMTSLNVQGKSIPLPSGRSSYAAIDTGTTLIAGPSSIVDAVYAQIPGSQPGTGQYEGYYFYPCSSNVAITLAFGGKSWPITNVDFQVSPVDRQGTLCLGAFFSIGSGGSAPPWIVGDAFLKNVLSVYRFDPPSVGFAQLSPLALSMNGANVEPPTPTIGSVAATVQATNRGNNNRSGNAALAVRGVGVESSMAGLVVSLVMSVAFLCV